MKNIINALSISERLTYKYEPLNGYGNRFIGKGLIKKEFYEIENEFKYKNIDSVLITKYEDQDFSNCLSSRLVMQINNSNYIIVNYDYNLRNFKTDTHKISNIFHIRELEISEEEHEIVCEIVFKFFEYISNKTQIDHINEVVGNEIQIELFKLKSFF